MISLENFKNYTAINSTENILEICHPLKTLGIDLFCYHKIFDDCTEIILSNNTIWAQHFYQKNYFFGKQEVTAMQLNEFNHVIWPIESNFNILKDIRDICGIFHGVSFRLTSKDCIELFGFSTKSTSSAAINNFLRNINSLERFCIYFKNRAASIISKSEDSKIIIPKSVAPKISKTNNNSESFLKLIELEKFYLNIPDSNSKIYLTKRELNTLQYFIKGYTLKEIGKEMQISPRTVEDYLTNIKQKIGVNNSYELITFIYEHCLEKYLY